jgi:YVTN family beta-propeller protein
MHAVARERLRGRYSVMRASRRGLVALGFITVAAVTIGGFVTSPSMRSLATGKWITPEGFQAEVGNFPANMALSQDGKYVVVTNTGFRQQLSVLDADSGALVAKVDSNGARDRQKEALYYGLAFAKQGDETFLYASRGVQDKVSVYRLGKDGALTFVKDLANPAPAGSPLPHHIAGVDLSANGSRLYAVNNQTHEKNDFRGSLSVIDTANGSVVHKIEVGGFPLAVAALTKGAHADRRVFVSNERDGTVTVVDPEEGRVTATIETGELPAYVRLNAGQDRLYVANSGSDTVSEIDTDSLRVLRTFLLRPGAYRGLPGSTPLGMDLSPDGKRLFVAMADLNAVAVVDLTDGDLEGYLPAGWYPTSVVVSEGGDRLLVSNAKGVKTRNPNGTPVRKGAQSQYGPVIIEGTVANLDLSQELSRLNEHTDQVLANNRADGDYVERSAKAFRNPGIEHVIYIVKENRTYDQVLGDLPRGNGKPDLCLFPREVTPNQHALAERFALLDNFYVCAEVSADGWNWSTAGMANEYVQRNTFTNYGGRGRNYDFEGTNNGVAPDLLGKRDVATPTGGYLWDAALAAGGTIRNFGMFTAFDPGGERPETRIMRGDGVPTKKALTDRTSHEFRRYDMAYADSEAWVKYGLKAAPKQLAAYGKFNDPSRITAWKREFAEMVRTRSMPKLMLVRLGRDHTSGTTAGQYSPRACVADNDYAVGQVVEAVSKSPFWRKTVICVLEDDAQAGFDHIDSHRSIAFVISPFVERGTHDATFYNTDSMLRSICLLIGAKPMNQYVATATPFGFFGRRATNAAPYEAILPAREIVAEVNTPVAYRAADSARLIDPLEEESMPDIELNDILWGAIKGVKTPRPATPNARWRGEESDDEEEAAEEARDKARPRRNP